LLAVTRQTFFMSSNYTTDSIIHELHNKSTTILLLVVFTQHKNKKPRFLRSGFVNLEETTFYLHTNPTDAIKANR
jgi:hypothetical protein